eukprot:365333-Chlamydomonas_euryale.AAC.17
MAGHAAGYGAGGSVSRCSTWQRTVTEGPICSSTAELQHAIGAAPRLWRLTRCSKTSSLKGLSCFDMGCGAWRGGVGRVFGEKGSPETCQDRVLLWRKTASREWCGFKCGRCAHADTRVSKLERPTSRGARAGMGKKRKLEVLDPDAEKTLYTSFVTAANSISSLYTQAVQQQRKSSAAASRLTLVSDSSGREQRLFAAVHAC